MLSDSGNFPSDLYIAQGLLGSLGRGHVLKVVEPEEVEAEIDDSVAVLMLTEVDYRSGRLHDMSALTAKAQAAGARPSGTWRIRPERFRSTSPPPTPISRSAAPTNI